MKKFIQYLSDVRSELAKVTWPNREELVGATTLVIVLSLTFAAIVKAFDLVLNWLLKMVLSI